MSRAVTYGEDGITVLEITEQKSGNYFITSLAYNQQFPIYKQVRGDFQFGINNLFDYVNHDAASNNPGRVCYVSLGINF